MKAPIKKRRHRAVARAEQARSVQVRSSNARRWMVWTFFGLLLMLSVALRVAYLTSQSFWADEGNSVRVTERSLSLVIDAARGDVHPPGYYVLLWGWAKVFGQGEAAMRMLSVVVGVLLVGLTYLLTARLAGARIGWLAAFCAAVSPFQIQYSQEVRMYILVAFWGAGVIYAFVRWLEAVETGTERPWWQSLVYVVAVAGGLWTHYSFPIVVVVVNVVWLVWWVRRHVERRWWAVAGWWLSTQLAALALYAPWLPSAWSRITGYGAISEPYSVSFVIREALKLLSVGETVPADDLTLWLVLGFVILALLGAWMGFSRRMATTWRAVGTFALVGVVLAPMAMMVGLRLAGRPAYRPKFFLLASPAFCALVGMGIGLLEAPTKRSRTLSNRAWLLLGLALVSVGAARSLNNYYLNPSYARSDYRGIAEAIRSMEREGDAILLDAPNQWEVLTYYYQDGAPVFPLCRSRPPVETEVVKELEEIAARHERLFALYWALDESDPERIVERWLEANTFKASDTWYGDVRLVIYATPENLALVEMETALADVRMGDAILLRGYTLAPTDPQPGDVLQLTLFWEALAVPDTRYKVFVHLQSEGGSIVSQYDGEPGHGMNLTTGWHPEQGVFRDRYGIVVPGGLARGKYRLFAGLYDISGSPRLPIRVDGVLIGDALLLGTIEIGS